MTFTEHLQFLSKNGRRFQLWKAVTASEVACYMRPSNPDFERVCGIVYDYTLENEVDDINGVAYIIVDGLNEREITLDDPKLSYYIKSKLEVR